MLMERVRRFAGRLACVLPPAVERSPSVHDVLYRLQDEDDCSSAGHDFLTAPWAPEVDGRMGHTGRAQALSGPGASA